MYKFSAMEPVLIAGSAVKTEIGNFKLGSAVFIIVRSQKIESHMKTALFAASNYHG